VSPSQIDNADAGAAQVALAAAIAYYASLSTTTIPSALDTQTLTPGNYSFASGAATLNGGTLTLNGAGTYVIKTASTLTVAAGSIVTLTGGATVDNVVFLVGSSATFAGANTFIGNILATASITLNGGTFNGRALANNGAVTISSATTITSPTGSTSLVIGSGSTLTYSGTGIINANEIEGIPVSIVSLIPGDVLVYNGTYWVNAGLPAITSLNLLIFANNAAAISGGLFAGELYRTGGNPDLVAVVH
jgi:hypothetical protein